MEHEYFLMLAQQAGEHCHAMLNGSSGMDVAESELYRAERLLWIRIYEGTTFEMSAKLFVQHWKTYAASNNAAVERAPKVRSGPYAGSSSISYRWVNPLLAESKLEFFHYIYSAIIETRKRVIEISWDSK